MVEHVKEVFGLLVPRTLAVYWGFVRSLSEAEREASGDLLPRSAGLLEYFAFFDQEREARDGLPECLHWRYRGDPPELVTVALGHSDAQHFGLFYDDPARLPCGVAENYARDTAQTWWEGETLLDVARQKLDVDRGELEHFYAEEDWPRVACQIRLLRDAISAFDEANRAALADDAPELPMSYTERLQLPEIVSGIGVLAPGTSPPPHVVATAGRARPFRDEGEVRGMIEEARRALKGGDVAHALALGRDLHWAEMDGALDLLVEAYHALGREPLAVIAREHHRHRDLDDVQIFSAVR